MKPIISNPTKTFELSLHELTSLLDDLKELMNTKFGYVEKIMDERHHLYKERAEAQKIAVEDALAASKEQTQASFIASEKAIVKAEESQKTYNQGHNDLSRKMEGQYSTMVPQSEAKLKWDSIDKAIEENRKDVAASRIERQDQVNSLRLELMREIQNLRESRSEGAGESKRAEKDSTKTAAVVGLVVTSIISILGVVALAIPYLVKH